MDTSHSGPKRKSYDLRLRAGERRLVWNNPDPDHGLTLTDHDIAWIAGRRQSQASLRDIVEVHLQIGYIRNDAIASCRLRIADGSTVLISSESSGGLEDAALAGRTPSVLAISADCVPVSSQATAAPKAAPASAAAVWDATHPQICHCTSGIGRVALRHPGEVVPALAGAKNVNALLSEFSGTCGNYQHLKHALHLPRPLIRLLEGELQNCGRGTRNDGC